MTAPNLGTLALAYIMGETSPEAVISYRYEAEYDMRALMAERDTILSQGIDLTAVNAAQAANVRALRATLAEVRDYWAGGDAPEALMARIEALLTERGGK